MAKIKIKKKSESRLGDSKPKERQIVKAPSPVTKSIAGASKLSGRTPGTMEISVRKQRVFQRTSSPSTVAAKSSGSTVKSRSVKSVADRQAQILAAYKLMKAGGTALLELGDVMSLTRLSRATVYRRVKDGDLPAPKKIRGRNFWNLAALDAAIN